MISVIVPYWNAEKWIKRCADSLKNQQGDFEFIFVNDHSKDNGAQLLRKTADSRFVMMDNHHKPGVSGARNTGLDIARGEWVTFLDSDDELMTDAWNKFNEAAETGEAIHQFNHIRHYTINPALNVNRHKYDNRPGTYTVKDLPQVWFGVWNKLYRKDLLSGIRFDETLQYGEDLIFNLECLAKSGEIHQSKATTVRHNVENIRSLSHIRTAEDLVKELKALEDYILRHKDRALRRLAYSLIEERLARSWYKKAICG